MGDPYLDQVIDEDRAKIEGLLAEIAARDAESWAAIDAMLAADREDLDRLLADIAAHDREVMARLAPGALQPVDKLLLLTQ